MLKNCYPDVSQCFAKVYHQLVMELLCLCSLRNLWKREVLEFSKVWLIQAEQQICTSSMDWVNKDVIQLPRPLMSEKWMALGGQHAVQSQCLA